LFVVGMTVSVTLVPGGGLAVSRIVAESSEYCGSGVAEFGIWPIDGGGEGGTGSRRRASIFADVVVTGSGYVAVAWQAVSAVNATAISVFMGYLN
jgi:hypothetical protein